ncbi:hypothetical protein MASR2M29_20180 [Spirochaetota bacterium]
MDYSISMSQSKNHSKSGSDEIYSFSDLCSDTIELYKLCGKKIQSPALRKMLESVIRQKEEQCTLLKTMDLKTDKTEVVFFVEPESDVFAFLEALVEQEKHFAFMLEESSNALSDNETRLELKAAADNSRKFSSWAKDHLDLLSMF